MTITLRSKPTDKLIELGGGATPLIRPNVDIRPCSDAQGNPTVDFIANFEEPLPIKSEEFDGVFCQFVIEHLSWRKVPGFLKEVFRILKPGGKVVFVTANTPAQIKFIQENTSGWDEKNPFESFSCILFGDQDYPDNTHRNFMSPVIIKELLHEAGFSSYDVHPYGSRETDMVVEAVRRVEDTLQVDKPKESYQDSFREMLKSPSSTQITTHPTQKPEELFDKHYFNGGGKVGGYALPGLWDFPCHEITASHVLARKPESVLELGCARGYILKRLQDANVAASGLEISKHCYLTMVAEEITLWDMCKTPWPVSVGNKADLVAQGDGAFRTIPKIDLCFSIATLEHIPESVLPDVIKEMVRTCKRGLHGIDFGAKDDGFDKTHCTLKPKEWWEDKFAKYAPGWPVEILNKEDLERGEFPPEVLAGDGKVKLNIGSFTTMHHHGWINIDVHDLAPFAQQYRYNYQRCDVRRGLPYPTQGVDLIMSNHFLEHLTYEEGLAFLKECRRVLKPTTGAMRIVVPDAALLVSYYASSNFEESGLESLKQLDEINEGCAASPTPLGKLWSLLHAGHQAAYDEETLCHLLEQAGFTSVRSHFRELAVRGFKQIKQETLDTLPSLSLFINSICRTA